MHKLVGNLSEFGSSGGVNGGKHDGVVLEGVAIDPGLLDVLGLDIDVFELFGGDVFSLREFENVFGSVDDSNGIVIV